MLPVPLTEPEKIAIRGHLGYLQVTQASSFALGTPSSLETQFIIEGALNNIPGTSLGHIRDLIAKCDATEEQIMENTENLAVTKICNLELNPREYEQLLQRYEYWRQKLANALGVVCNPFDKRPIIGGGGSGLSVPVRG